MSRKQINKRRKKDKKLWKRVKFEYLDSWRGYTVQLWYGGLTCPKTDEWIIKYHVCVFKEKTKPWSKEVYHYETFKEALISFEEEIRKLQCQSTNT